MGRTSKHLNKFEIIKSVLHKVGVRSGHDFYLMRDSPWSTRAYVAFVTYLSTGRLSLESHRGGTILEQDAAPRGVSAHLMLDWSGKDLLYQTLEPYLSGELVDFIIEALRKKGFPRPVQIDLPYPVQISSELAAREEVLQSRSKRGKRSQYSRKHRDATVLKWERMDKDTNPQTLDDFLANEFGDNEGTFRPLVSRRTFYNWREDYYKRHPAKNRAH